MTFNTQLRILTRPVADRIIQFDRDQADVGMS